MEYKKESAIQSSVEIQWSKTGWENSTEFQGLGIILFSSQLLPLRFWFHPLLSESTFFFHKE